MNYYPHHIGDYNSATRHLTMLEHGAYRLLLDLYYTREAPLPADLAAVCRLVVARSKEECKAVEQVVKEFFALASDGWRHKRCDEEIVKANEAADRARANGKKGGRPKTKKEPTANPEETHPVISGLASGNPEITNSKAPNPNPNPNTTSSLRSEAAVAAPGDFTTPKAMIFSVGLGLLMQAGTPEQSARSFLGKHARGNETKLSEVIGYLAANPKIEPKAYIEAAMAPEKARLAL